MPKERQFLGFDAYRKAIDCLRPGDVAILTTHAAFRPTHLEYAVEKGVNVFMEKSFASDPGGTQQVLRAGEAAEKKNLKIAAGLMCRHSSARQALIQKMRDGAMGDIQLIRAYRMDPGWRHGAVQGRAKRVCHFQIRNACLFLWTTPGLFIELMIHQIDECCWIKDAWPVAAHGVGGRVAHSTDCSQNLDSYSIEYTFADGAKALVTGRYIPNCFNDFITYVHGTKCAAQFSGNVHAPSSQIYKDQRIADNNVAWKPKREQVNPWQAEWNVLLERHPQRSAAQRGPPGGAVEPGGHHGPGGRAYRKGHHLGRDDGLEVQVLHERGRLSPPTARPRFGPTPRAVIRRPSPGHGRKFKICRRTAAADCGFTTSAQFDHCQALADGKRVAFLDELLRQNAVGRRRQIDRRTPRPSPRRSALPRPLVRLVSRATG